MANSASNGNLPLVMSPFREHFFGVDNGHSIESDTSGYFYFQYSWMFSMRFLRGTKYIWTNLMPNATQFAQIICV